MEKKKYTVIYSESFTVGSHRNSITKKHYIECAPKNLKTVVEEEIGWSNVYFVFDGHCEETMD